jgi:transcriptional regulator with XRE-family HTH domain
VTPFLLEAPSVNPITFGGLIHRARKTRGLTLDVLATKIKSSKGYLSGIENGKVRPPTSTVVALLAKHLVLPDTSLQLLAYSEKAPKHVRHFPEVMEFREAVTALFREGGAEASGAAQ